VSTIKLVLLIIIIIINIIINNITSRIIISNVNVTIDYVAHGAQCLNHGRQTVERHV